jgi:hypothetical protein
VPLVMIKARAVPRSRTRYLLGTLPHGVTRSAGAAVRRSDFRHAPRSGNAHVTRTQTHSPAHGGAVIGSAVARVTRAVSPCWYR